MRVAWLGIALVLLSTGSAGAAQTPRFLPQSIAFWDSTHGIATFLACGQKDCLGEIATTRDGGKSWIVRMRPPRIGDVTVVRDSAEAWVQAPDGFLWTLDRGRTWRRIRRTTGLTGVTFPTSRVGYALRGRQYELELVRTSNRGRTWRQLPLPCGRVLNRDGILSFVTSRHGWLLCDGQPGTGSQLKRLYETLDGARSWRPLPRSGATALYGGGYALGMSMARSANGLIWEARGPTYVTSNGGRKWRPVTTTSPEVREGRSGWVVSRRTSYLLVWDNDRADVDLVRSDDAARTWRSVHSWSRR
jgi:photosystem II stability/assembly factor-like uncharacterized protein